MNTKILNWFDWTALSLVIVGAVNWGLVGFFQFDLVATIFGGIDTTGARVVYSLVGLAGLYSIYSLSKTYTLIASMTTTESNQKKLRRVA